MAGKRKKDSVDLDWNPRSEMLVAFASLPLDQIDDKLRDVRTGEIWLRRGVVFEQFSHGNRDLDDETADALEEEDYDGHLGENTGIFQSPDFGFVENAKIFLGGGVGSFGGGTEGFEFMMPVCSAEDLDDQPGEVVDRHMTSKSVIIDPVLAVFGVLTDLRII